MTKENYRQRLLRKLDENFKNNPDYNLIKEFKNTTNPSEYNLLKDVIKNNKSTNLWKELQINIKNNKNCIENTAVEIEFKGKIKFVVSIQRLLNRKWISLENLSINWNCITSCCSSQQDSLNASDLISMLNGKLIFINYINMGYGGYNEFDRLCCYDIYF